MLASKCAVLSLAVMSADSWGRHLLAACVLYRGIRDWELVNFMSNVLQMHEEYGFREGRRLSLPWEGPWHCTQQLKDPPPIILVAVQAWTYIQSSVCWKHSIRKTEFLVKYLPVLDPVLLVVEVAASHSNFEELGLHMYQQDICCS